LKRWLFGHATCTLAPTSSDHFPPVSGGFSSSWLQRKKPHFVAAAEPAQVCRARRRAARTSAALAAGVAFRMYIRTLWYWRWPAPLGTGYNFARLLPASSSLLRSLRSSAALHAARCALRGGFTKAPRGGRNAPRGRPSDRANRSIETESARDRRSANFVSRRLGSVRTRCSNMCRKRRRHASERRRCGHASDNETQCSVSRSAAHRFSSSQVSTQVVY
jgi:hypothetical protein